MLARAQITVSQAEDLAAEITAIRSTYFDEDGDKMPADYETISEALEDAERYGSVWIHTKEQVYQLCSDDGQPL
jgi:hypothetical protein